MNSTHDSIQKQINKINYENHMRKQLIKIENNTTQILKDNIKTSDLGLVTLALLNRHEPRKIPNEHGFWLIKKNKETEDLYRQYKNQEALVNLITFSKTLTNLITKDITNYA